MDNKIMKSEFINVLPKYYNKNFKQNNKVIKLHHKKYINDKYAPAWKTLEFFNFGNCIEIYNKLKDENLKKEISSKYKLKSPVALINFLNTVRSIRNICAHGGVLFDYKLAKRIKEINEISLPDNYSLYSCIKIILFLFETISLNRKNNLESDLKELFSKYKNNLVIKNIIMDTMKFEEKFLK
jgi:abortive infection bacteriophage resistance protein